jgi:cytochrome P450
LFIRRLYPPVPFDTKYAVEEDVLPNGCYVPKHALIEWSAWIMGRHPKFWENPLDVDPNRWSEENSKKIHPFLFIPFQAAPRLCLGKILGKSF